jgi:hypothetical protein
MQFHFSLRNRHPTADATDGSARKTREHGKRQQVLHLWLNANSADVARATFVLASLFSLSFALHSNNSQLMDDDETFVKRCVRSFTFCVRNPMLTRRMCSLTQFIFLRSAGLSCKLYPHAGTTQNLVDYARSTQARLFHVITLFPCAEIPARTKFNAEADSVCAVCLHARNWLIFDVLAFLRFPVQIYYLFSHLRLCFSFFSGSIKVHIF